VIIFIGEEHQELENVGYELLRVVNLALFNGLQLLQHESSENLDAIKQKKLFFNLKRNVFSKSITLEEYENF
jgi:hypothetical protein